MTKKLAKYENIKKTIVKIVKQSKKSKPKK